jgi:putative Holliday junction resolvase
MPDTATTHAITALAFDFGTGQIGIAVGQTLTGHAQPLQIIKAKDGNPNWADIEKVLQEWQPDRLIVGLPLNMDGSESDFCARARKFARRLHGRFGTAVEMVDERLSSFEAKQQSGQHSRFRDNPVDDTAACLILETWLQNPNSGKRP